MRLTVDKIKHVLTEDIDPTQQMDVSIVDGFVFARPIWERRAKKILPLI
jgi:hypothetical protein